MASNATPNRCSSTNPGGRPVRRARDYARLLGLGTRLLAAATVGLAVLTHALPQSPLRPQGLPDRLGWYLRHGQLQADLRTAACVAAYFMAGEPPPFPALDGTNSPVARTVSQPRPTSEVHSNEGRAPT
jgi:hypothetical protein